MIVWTHRFSSVLSHHHFCQQISLILLGAGTAGKIRLWRKVQADKVDLYLLTLNVKLCIIMLTTYDNFKLLEVDLP